MVSSQLPVRPAQLLHIQPPHPQAPLSEAQQAFNRLLTQMEEARKQWQVWQDASQEVHTRYAKQVRPVLAQLWLAQAVLAQWLDARTGEKMSKRDHQTLVQVIVQLSEAGAQEAQEESVRKILAELHARYAHHEEGEKGAKDTAEVSVQAVDCDGEPDVDWSDPDAVAAYVEAQTQAAQAQAQRARSAHQQRRQREQEQRKAQQATKPSVRAVYRKLASSLHPDREQDAQARERKTALMQRVNQAYEADDLLALLELQWAVEQLDASRLAQMQDAHLLRYNHVLQEQLQELQKATRDAQVSLAQMLGLDPRQRHAPHKMPALLRQYAQSLQQQVLQLQQIAQQLQHEPSMLEQWLRAQR